MKMSRWVAAEPAVIFTENRRDAERESLIESEVQTHKCQNDFNCFLTGYNATSTFFKKSRPKKQQQSIF